MENTTPVISQAKDLTEQIVQWRRWLHANPELSFQEHHTAQFIAQTLATIPGMKVTTQVAKTGVVGTLSSGTGPVIALRADMDALPINEQNQTSYRSLHEGVMHACGHDAHVAILLGVAQLLGERFQSGQLQGTVKCIFQPAEEDPDEEGLTGAAHLIREGIFEGVEAAIALHMDPEHPIGHVRIHDHYSMANVDIFEGSIRSLGGHAAYPHLAKDPIWMLGSVLQVLQTIVSRKISPLEPAVVSVTQIHAGTATNVLPAEVNVRGTLRSYHPDIRAQLISEVKEAFSLVNQLGGKSSCRIIQGEPALDNDPQINQWLCTTISDLFPTYQIKRKPFGLGGEDFGHVTSTIPGAMFFLGCGMTDGIKRELHTPIFDIDESCLPVGTAILAETAMRYLRGEYQFVGK